MGQPIIFALLAFGTAFMTAAPFFRKHWFGEAFAMVGASAIAVALNGYLQWLSKLNAGVLLLVLLISVHLGFIGVRRKRTRILAGIADSIAKGSVLRNRCFQGEDLLVLESDVLDWIATLDAFLKENLDDSYVLRVRNSAGLPSPIFRSREKPRQREMELYDDLAVRLARLEEFSRGIDP